jgi:hypothetical protein
MGLVGATASYASHHSWLHYELGLPSAYGEIYPSRKQARSQMIRFAQAQGIFDRGPGIPRRWLAALRRLPTFYGRFGPFPAAHIRTNGFALASDLMRMLDHPSIRKKAHAFRVEGGKRSITTQVEQLGLRAAVIGADREVYERDAWPASRTFWQGDQENLLLEDNQTRVYSAADLDLRTFLSRFGWGLDADPAPPSFSLRLEGHRDESGR